MAVRLLKSNRFWSVHTHSRYSAQDALPTPKEIVARAKELGYRGLGLTDHGNMAGSIELYMECQKAGIKPFPGSEMYLVEDRRDKKAKRTHVCMVAYTTQGYRNLIKISTDSHKNYYRKPLIDLADLANYAEMGWSEGIALTTGCFFGLVIQTLLKDGYDDAKRLVAAYSSWFDTYVEVQAHKIEREEGLTEDEIAASLVRIADELGLPVLITQDSHYVREGDRPTHDTLKRLVSFGPDMDEVVFPGDGYHLVGDEWMRGHHSSDVFDRGVAGLDSLLAKHDLRITEADSYDYRVPSIADDPDLQLRQRCFQALSTARLLKPRYLDRLDEELGVIAASRMGNYMLLVALVCDYMREQGIHYQTRGSAAGSLVCWMLGISNIDPIKTGARFDRFLSKDRTKPPDIDLDVENLRRRDVLEWVGQRFAISQVCTWGVLGMDAKDNSKGSLKVKYFSKRRAHAKANGHEMGFTSWSKVPDQDKKELYTLADMQTFGNYGVHPCALVLVNSRTELEEMVPLQWVASSKTMVSQYDGNVIESIGLIKLDLLGSKTMSVLRIACENIGMPTSDLEKIPFDSPKVYSMLSRGDTDGLYQMEGYTTSKGCTRLKPRKISEVVDAMALFRPGVMNSGATESYIKRKFGQEEIPERHPLIAKGTEKTRGILLYQDQIIAILRDLGLGADDLTRFLKAVKASNKKVDAAKAEIDYYMPIIERMCKERGMSDADYDWMQKAFVAFAEYSFNIAHATVYGYTAYRCAYLAVHHGVEFHAALLAVAAGTDKEKQYVSATRRRGLRIKSPSLNHSKEKFAMDPSRKYIRKGFLAIKGIGPRIARDLVAGQTYENWDDFYTKSIGTKVSGVKDFKAGVTTKENLVGAVKALYDAEAFDDLIGKIPLGKTELDLTV